MRNRSVSVTGATGFLGWRIAERFRDEGWTVTAIVRPANRKAVPDRVAVVEAALDDPAALTRAIPPGAVLVHAAGIVRAPTPSAFHAVNVEGTRAAVAAANAAAARLILISSQAAAGTGTRDRPAREQADPRPVNAYGRSKLAGEQVVRDAASIPWTILRPSAVYGPRDRGFLPLFRMAKRGWFLEVAEPSACFTLTHVDDVARAVSLAATADAAVGQTVFVGHPEPHHASDLMRELAAIYGRSYRALPIPAWVVRAAAAAGDVAWKAGLRPPLDRSRYAELRAEGFVCDVAHARETLAFSAAIPLAEGLRTTAQWYAEQKWV